jgi:predicted CXXCH cytochrome family protein
MSANYVGANTCKQCHQAEFKAWSGSHHDLAMQVANVQTVLGNFNNATFQHNGVVSTFFQRDGKFMVRTDGPDGKLTDYPISYTFGVYPLQQYLIDFPGGRKQALAIAWDARAKDKGGQRWFHLNPKDKIDHTDQLHWTGRYQNWNLQCAECHSTNLKKGYDATTDSYKTTFSEINVACESCHGPGSGHITWTKQVKPPYTPDDDKGLTVPQMGWNSVWKFATPEARYAQRDHPADPAAMNACAACHSRRSTIAEGGMPGAPLEDSHRLAVLTPPNYHADGQQQGEVYAWGSFLQSKMYHKGVTCMDCHEPHTLKLRAEGNALCVRCHNAAEFDTIKHHKHTVTGKGAQCAECHMPTQNYMVIHARPDHSIRVPRPDLSMSLGSPNACIQCHAGKKPEWAVLAMDKWYGKAWRDRLHYGPTLHAAETQGVMAVPALMALAQDATTPALVRATAVTLAQPYMNPNLLQTARLLLQDADPTMRLSALGMIESVDPVNRVLAASSLLTDSVRGVRIEAARILADIPDSQFPVGRQAERERALKEYVDSLKLDADWPTASVNLGNLYQRQGHLDEAVVAYERALMLDIRFVGAYVNLADAYRQQGREDEAEKMLRRGLLLLPDAADLHHVLGLLLVRKKDNVAALKELSEASKLAPDNARYAYVYAIGLNSIGKRAEALTMLRKAATRHAYDMNILSALVSINREAGDAKAALVYARKAAEAMPDDPSVKKLVAELEATQ